jgi:hypothetical protein
MTFYCALLLVAVIAMALLGVVAMLVRLDKTRPAKQYDERQQSIRGKAFEWAFVLGVLYFAVILFLDVLLPNGLRVSTFVVVTAGIALEAFVASCYCSFHNAYLPLTQSPKVNITVLYVMGAVQLFVAVNNANGMRIDVTENGISKVSFGEVLLSADKRSAFVWMPLMVAEVSIVLATLELVRFIRDNRSKQ